MAPCCVVEASEVELTSFNVCVSHVVGAHNVRRVVGSQKVCEEWVVGDAIEVIVEKLGEDVCDVENL